MSDRPVIVALTEEADGSDIRVTITLEWQDQRHSGQALGEANLPHRPRLAAEATLRAVEHLTGDTVPMDLLAVATANLGDVRVALAQVRLGEAGETLVGTALMADTEPSVAAVRAVMSALNRRLGLLL